MLLISQMSAISNYLILSILFESDRPLDDELEEPERLLGLLLSDCDLLLEELLTDD